MRAMRPTEDHRQNGPARPEGEQTMTTRRAHQPATGGLRGKPPNDTAGTPDRCTAKSADELLIEARALLPHRPHPPRRTPRKPGAPCSSTSAATTSGAAAG